jgi:hypothetical protein
MPKSRNRTGETWIESPRCCSFQKIINIQYRAYPFEGGQMGRRILIC